MLIFCYNKEDVPVRISAVQNGKAGGLMGRQHPKRLFGGKIHGVTDQQTILQRLWYLRGVLSQASIGTGRIGQSVRKAAGGLYQLRPVRAALPGLCHICGERGGGKIRWPKQD